MAPLPPLPLPHARPNPHASPTRTQRTQAVPWTRGFPALGLSRGRLALDLAIARRRRHRPSLATTGRSSLLPPAPLAHAHCRRRMTSSRCTPPPPPPRTLLSCSTTLRRRRLPLKVCICMFSSFSFLPRSDGNSTPCSIDLRPV